MSSGELQTQEGSVEYVELLNVPVYDNGEIITSDDGEKIVSLENTAEVITVNDDEEEEEEQIEYVEAEEIAYDEESSDVQAVNGHTVFIHEGKQYIIPNELSQDGQTIILEGDEEDTEYVIQTEDDQESTLTDSGVVSCVETCYEDAETDENGEILEQNPEQEDNTCYIIYGDNGETVTRIENEDESSTLSKQYAILKDGKLHIQANGSDNETNDIQEKLQVLEDSLNYAEETVQEEQFEVTGRNLITGQTISLNGFLEKLRKKADPVNIKEELGESECYPASVKRQRRNFYQSHNSKTNLELPKQDYVLIPPVNKNVVVGKTPDGKRVIGKILQIQKKIAPSINLVTPEINTRNDLPTSSTQKPTEVVPISNIQSTPKVFKAKIQKTSRPLSAEIPKCLEDDSNQNQQIAELIINNTGKILHVENHNLDNKSMKNEMKRKYLQKSTTPDDNLIRTLSGLMELETIQKNLIAKKLIIKHVSKKTFQGKSIPGKIVTYHFGYMQKTESVDCFNEPKECWIFVPTADEEEGIIGDNSIDLQQENQDNQQINMIVNSDGKIETDDTDALCIEHETQSIKQEFEETVTVNLIITEDEHGKKRTKVMIPQLADKEYTCHICTKTFTTPGSLKRHITTHDPSSRPMQCLTCSLRFPDESSLKKHMLLHIGIKRFRCEICLKSFVHQGDLNFHRKIHDPVKRYKCEVCSKQFNRYSNMMRHLDIHRVKASAFKCHLCGCQYNFISSLTRHIVNIHMGGESSMSKEETESMETS